MIIYIITIIFGASAAAGLSVAVYHQIRETKCEIKNSMRPEKCEAVFGKVEEQANFRGCK